MNGRAWLFSARRAWRRKSLRGLTIATCLLLAGASGYYWWNVLPSARSTGTVVLHYNIYFGIDDVRSAPWVLFLPAVWILCTLGGIAWGYASYHQDPTFADSLIAFAFFWSLPWVAALFYLTLVNR